MELHIFELSGAESCAAFARFAAAPYSLFLDSADRAHPDARYSFIAFQPMETIEAKDGVVTVTNPRQQTRFRADPFEVTQERLKAYAWGNEFAGNAPADLPPFRGGAAGFFGYDLARGIERLPQRAAAEPGMPDMAIGIYDKVIAFDHAAGKAWLMIHADDKDAAEAKRHFVFSMYASTPSCGSGNEMEPAWRSNFTKEQYETRVRRVIEYIHAGDIFQTNLSQRFDADFPADFDAFAHYETLRAVNPAPFAGFMNLGDVQISSASPERFLKCQNGIVETKPIKGTRPRHANAANDEKQTKDLRASEKDRAENIMIVDLLRNDLSKVCEASSVNVEKLCAVESFAGVHHLVSTISGRLRAGRSALDLLRACFPGGSITGAPKIRAMEIIEELEPTRRGPYCGAMGYIGFDDSMDMNILIRTLVYQQGRVHFQVGGGITADSDPAAEYQETLDKAQRIFESFEKGAFVEKVLKRA